VAGNITFYDFFRFTTYVAFNIFINCGICFTFHRILTMFFDIDCSLQLQTEKMLKLLFRKAKGFIYLFFEIIFCRNGGEVIRTSNPGTGRIWLDNVECTGSETHIFDCRHNGWGRHNCGHSEDVSIRCHSSTYGNVSIILRSSSLLSSVSSFS